ncbi:MAG: MarR family winged helix-turn-helix transcriptional regulator [Xanthobacteraceae bacterium]|nr:MarR family winged helix-turn-helix transcriptional regulator [Xanthobacteraceae bacterium]
MSDDPCICTSLRQAAHLATEIYDQALEPSGLKITMFRVMRRLSEADQPTISELARIVELDRSSLGRNLRVLQRMKLVRFSDGDDERAKVVSLTPLGVATLEDAKPLWRRAQARMRTMLGEGADTVYAVRASVGEEAARLRA